jgi:hypothetical protein
MWILVALVFGLIGIAYIVGGFRIYTLSRDERERRRIERIRAYNAAIDTIEPECECGDPLCGLDSDQLRGRMLYARNVPNDDPFPDPYAAKALSKQTLH